MEVNMSGIQAVAYYTKGQRCMGWSLRETRLRLPESSPNGVPWGTLDSYGHV